MSNTWIFSASNANVTVSPVKDTQIISISVQDTNKEKARDIANEIPKVFKKEAKRCLNNFCEVDENWNSNGKVYTKGLAVIEENEKKRFIKQAKVCDIGILN